MRALFVALPLVVAVACDPPIGDEGEGEGDVAEGEGELPPFDVAINEIGCSDLDFVELTATTEAVIDGLFITDDAGDFGHFEAVPDGAIAPGAFITITLDDTAAFGIRCG